MRHKSNNAKDFTMFIAMRRITLLQISGFYAPNKRAPKVPISALLDIGSVEIPGLLGEI